MLDNVAYNVLHCFCKKEDYQMTPETLKDDLPKAMAEFKITTVYLANKLGVSFYTVRSWLNGERKPKHFVITRIEQILNGFKNARE